MLTGPSYKSSLSALGMFFFPDEMRILMFYMPEYISPSHQRKEKQPKFRANRIQMGYIVYLGKGM